MENGCRKFWLSCLAAGCVSFGSSNALAEGGGDASSQEEQREELGLIYGEESLTIATRRAAPLRTAPIIASVITSDEIRKMGARNLLDVLKMVPGIGVSIGENGVYMVEVQGIRIPNNDKILFMIDGHSMNKNLFGSALYVFGDSLPVENIKRVEVARGPGSALYGNSAFVATINVVTRDADEIDGVEAKVGLGSFNTSKVNLVGAHGDGDKLVVTGSIDFYNSDGAKLRVDKDALRNTRYSAAPGHTDLSVEQVDAFVKVLYGDFSFRGHYINTKKGRNIGPRFALSDNDYLEAENYWGELGYSSQLSSDVVATFKAYYDHYQQSPNYKSLPNGYAGSFPSGLITRFYAQQRTLGAEGQIDWQMSANNRLITGLTYENSEQYGVKNISNANPFTGAYLGGLQEVANFNRDVSRKSMAAFVQDEWQMLKSVNLTAGIRTDHYSDFGTTTNPRGGLVWTPTDEMAVKLLYGRAFRAPTFTELYATSANRYASGNPNLRPERIATWNGAVSYQLTRAVTLDVGVFRSEITNLIGREGVNPAHYANIGKARTQGVEGELSVSQPSVRWKIGYAYQDPRDTDTGERLPYVPTHRAKGSWSYDYTPSINFHTDLIWTGPRPRAVGEGRSTMPSYATVDLAATVRNLWNSVDWQVAVHNLLNKRYYDPDTSGAANLVPGDFPREGISFMTTLRMAF